MPEWHERARALFQKAKEDEWAVRHLAVSPEAPVSILGFHAQQAVEKYLKAVLAWRGIEFSRTHDLVELLDVCQKAGVELPDAADEFHGLIPFAVAMRYPATSPLPGNRDQMVRTFELLVTRAHRWAESYMGPEQNQ